MLVKDSRMQYYAAMNGKRALAFFIDFLITASFSA